MEGEQTVGQNQKNTQEPDMNQLRKVRVRNLQNCSRTEETFPDYKV